MANQPVGGRRMGSTIFCCAGTAYVDHRVYHLPCCRHSYHLHASGPHHVDVVDYPYPHGCGALRLQGADLRELQNQNSTGGELQAMTPRIRDL